MNEATIQVPEIHCDNCKASLEGAIGVIDGVSSVSVDVPTATISVTFDEGPTLFTIVEAIEGQGYEVPEQ